MQCGQWDTLNLAVDEIRQQWYSQFLPPPQEEDEDAVKYVKRVKKAQIAYRTLADNRITAMLTSATIGECAYVRAQGTSLKEGWRIPARK